MMVKDLRPRKSSAVNGNKGHRGNRVGDDGPLGEISKPLVLSGLIHVIVLVAVFAGAPYLATPILRMPPAQMVQLVDLPSGGGSEAARETLRSTPSKPASPPEPPR